MKTEFLIIIITIIVFLIYHYQFKNKDVVYVKSDIDDDYYLVRDVPDKLKAANMLARLKENIKKTTLHLVENKNDDYSDNKKYIEQLDEKIKNAIIQESDGNSEYTSYSVNKGEQIIFCLRSKRDSALHDLNLVEYVALHEMSHVACPEFGHTDLFKEIFAFIAQVAVDIGLYKKIDFSKNPVEYCGLMITDSII
jgi:predicted metal-dependent hydrolase